MYKQSPQIALNKQNILKNSFSAMPQAMALQRQVIQRHALIGAMIKGQENPNAANIGNWDNFNIDRVFDKSRHRGDLSNAYDGNTFDWNGAALSASVEKIRSDSGFGEDDPNFVVVANVNTYKTPGYYARPNDYTDNKHTFAFGSAWSLSYNTQPLADDPVYTSDYNQVLNAWQNLPKNPDAMVGEGIEPETLGNDATAVLRALTKKYWLANKNFVIPHRGLRNMTLEYINNKGIVAGLQERYEDDELPDQYVSIITLDDDLQVKDNNVIKSIMKQGEGGSQQSLGARNKNPRGIAFSSPGYIYNMEDNLLEYTASVLSHIGGRVISQSYPSEPGLTITYDRKEEESAWSDFLLKSPWGIENSDLEALPSYGRKQNRARVESKEGRAFADQFSNYLVKKGAPINSRARASYKVPIRGAGFFSVDMSGVAKEEILKQKPGNIAELGKDAVLVWLNNYIKWNKYHPIGGTSKDAKNFKSKVLPEVAGFVYAVIQKDSSLENKKTEILNGLENQSDGWYLNVMSGKKETTTFMFQKEEEDVDWPIQIQNQVLVRKIANVDHLKQAVIEMADAIERAFEIEPELEENVSDIISDSVSSYGIMLNLPIELVEILDFLVAEIIYDDDYTEALTELKENPDYKVYIEDLGR